jgi:hypothetical protein
MQGVAAATYTSACGVISDVAGQLGHMLRERRPGLIVIDTFKVLQAVAASSSTAPGSGRIRPRQGAKSRQYASLT